MVYPGACTDIVIPFTRYTSFDMLVCFDGLPGNDYWPPGCPGHELYGSASRFMKSLEEAADTIGKHHVTRLSPNVITFTFTSGRKILYYTNTEVPLPPDQRIWDHIKHAEALFISGYEPYDNDPSFYRQFPKLQTIYMAQPWMACYKLVNSSVKRVFWDGLMGSDGTELEIARRGVEYAMSNDSCDRGCKNCYPISQEEVAQHVKDYAEYLKKATK
jgi:hypothetical protein